MTASFLVTAAPRLGVKRTELGVRSRVHVASAIAAASYLVPVRGDDLALAVGDLECVVADEPIQAGTVHASGDVGEAVRAVAGAREHRLGASPPAAWIAP